MAKQVYTDFNMNESEIQNVSWEKLASDPTGPGLFAGRHWFNTTTGKYKFYDGTTVFIVATESYVQTVVQQIGQAQDVSTKNYVDTSLKSYRTNAEAAAETSTTSTTVYSTKITFNTPNLPLGDYEILAYYKARTGANRAMTIRIREGAANILSFDEPFMSNVADIAKRHIAGRLFNVSGVKTLTLEFKVGNTANSSGSTAYLSQAYLEIRRLYPI